MTLIEEVKPSKQDLADRDLFECDECHIIFDIDDSHKPKGKKGSMICQVCLAKFEAKTEAQVFFGKYPCNGEMILEHGRTWITVDAAITLMVDFAADRVAASKGGDFDDAT